MLKKIWISLLRVLIYHGFTNKIRIYFLKKSGHIIGDNVYIGIKTLIIGGLFSKHKITIGDRVSIAPRSNFIISSHPNYSKLKNIFSNSGDIVIKNDSWIGAGVSIYPGICIGEYSIVLTGSVVTKDVESYTIVGGIPAKFIKKIDVQILTQNS